MVIIQGGDPIMSTERSSGNIIRYTKIATIIALVLVVVGDVFGYIITDYISRVWADRSDTFAIVTLSIVYYLGTVGAIVVFINLYRLLNNMSKDIVFDVRNTKLMTIIGITCIFMGIDCVAGTVAWFGTIYMGVVCFFMMLVVFCVKAVFEKAIEMKEELDLTI